MNVQEYVSEVSSRLALRTSVVYAFAASLVTNVVLAAGIVSIERQEKMIALKDTKLPNRHSQLSSNDQNALPYEDRIQRILRAIPSLSHEHAEVLKGTITDGYLIGNPVAAWRLLGLRLERYHLMNQTQETLQIREADFYRRGVVAVATEATSLKPKASADLWIIREDAP